MIYEFAQKSPEWYQFRVGKFSASEFHKLFTSGRSKNDYFGQTALSYIDEKLTEIIMNGLNDDYGGFQGNNATEWGNYWEPVAREKFTEKTRLSVSQIGLFSIADKLIGSPDGVLDNGIIEIKCPYNPMHHVKNLYINSESDLSKAHYEHYIQMHVNILGFEMHYKKDATENYYISYDQRPQNSKFKLKIVKIERNQAILDEILERYEQANKILNYQIDYLLSL